MIKIHLDPVDPGHGGTDPGTLGDGYKKESRF